MDDSTRNVFGERLRKLRRAKGWTQEQLAKMLNVSRNAVAGWEAPSKRYFPDQETLVRIARLFGVSVDYLLGLIDVPRPMVRRPSETTGAGVEFDTALQWLLDFPGLMFDGLSLGDLSQEEKEDIVAMVRALMQVEKEKKKRAMQKAGEDEGKKRSLLERGEADGLILLISGAA